MLPTHKYPTQFERESYFSQAGFYKVDKGCIYRRLENHCTLVPLLRYSASNISVTLKCELGLRVVHNLSKFASLTKGITCNNAVSLGLRNKE